MGYESKAVILAAVVVVFVVVFIAPLAFPPRVSFAAAACMNLKKNSHYILREKTSATIFFYYKTHLDHAFAVDDIHVVGGLASVETLIHRLQLTDANP